jgi:drug/metabolite transporter (DMT)-like permease
MRIDRAADTPGRPAADRDSARRSMTIGLTCSALSGVLFSVSNVSASKALTEGLPVSLVTIARLAIGCLLLWAVKSLRKGYRVPGHLRLRLVAVGVLSATQVYCLYQAVQRLSPPLAVLLLYSYPAIVAVQSAAFLHAHLGRVKVLAVLTSLAGILLIVGVPTGRVTVAGCLFGLGSGLSLATYIVLMSRVTRGVAPLTAVAWLQLGAVTAGVAVSLGTVRLSPHPGGLGWLVVVGLASGTAAALFLTGLQRLTPTIASLASTIEPISTAGLAAVVLGVALTWVQLAGGLLIVSAVFIISFEGITRTGGRSEG